MTTQYAVGRHHLECLRCRPLSIGTWCYFVTSLFTSCLVCLTARCVIGYTWWSTMRTACQRVPPRAREGGLVRLQAGARRGAVSRTRRGPSPDAAPSLAGAGCRSSPRPVRHHGMVGHGRDRRARGLHRQKGQYTEDLAVLDYRRRGTYPRKVFPSVCPGAVQLLHFSVFIYWWILLPELLREYVQAGC